MKKATAAQLSPSQQVAYNGLRAGLGVGSILVLWAETGRGKSTILKLLQEESGGVYIDLRDFLTEQDRRHPLQIEETLAKIIRTKLKKHKLVLFDDLHLIDFHDSCGSYPRAPYLNAVMMGLAAEILNGGQKVVFAVGGRVSDSIRERAYSFGVAKFTAADYEWLVRKWIGDKAAEQVDFAKVYRFAPKLNAHQLKAACLWMNHFATVETESFIEYLRTQRLASNVDLREVQEVDLRSLKGVDDVLRSLEINIALPLENDELAARFKLRSKRGVLLYGPPGTGKTTVGRALAHRLKGKFFLIDGTFISGSSDFYGRVHHIFETAKENSPSVIFIDDADAIFEDGEERGLYRYLLTMLDGLESESSARVCVMMTAMNVAHLPPALVRSGRVELWLEMKLPSPGARREILEGHVGELPPELRPKSLKPLVQATEGFTGADLKRAVQDATAIIAYEVSKKAKLGPPLIYFLQAIETVRENKNRYSEALAGLATSRQKGDAGGSYSFSQEVISMQEL